MDKRTRIIIILSLIIIILLGYISYDKIYERAYEKGFADANTIITNNMIASLNQNGYIPFTIPITQNNETIVQTVKLGVIRER